MRAARITVARIADKPAQLGTEVAGIGPPSTKGAPLGDPFTFKAHDASRVALPCLVIVAAFKAPNVVVL